MKILSNKNLKFEDLEIYVYFFKLNRIKNENLKKKQTQTQRIIKSWKPIEELSQNIFRKLF